MLSDISIKSLYAPALAEGEGVGTAYEYYAKRLVLSRWLAFRPQTMLVAGLPQKYGSSLDFLLLAAEMGAAVTVVDERPFALQKMEQSLAAWQAAGWLPSFRAQSVAVTALPALENVADSFDLAIASEVLQRLARDEQRAYVARLTQLAPAVALFAPNADNPAHTDLSGLSGLTLAELRALLPPGAETGYIDMPPFPPGVVRSEEQRAQAGSGRLEALAMWGLAYYARLERFLPQPVRRKQSHIVYGLWRRA